MNIQTLKHFLLTLTLSLFIISCGGGSTQTAGIGGTGVTSSGTITGFGSIFVNGVEYDTSSVNSVIINDNPANAASLKLGMVVTVRGTLDASDTTMGTANSISAVIEVEGPIAATPVFDSNTDTRTFTVLGRTVIAAPSTFYDGGIDYASMNKDDVVDVSGYLDTSGVLHATRIEKKGTVKLGSTTIEAKGTVSILSGSSFTLTVSGANTLTINHSSSTTDYSGINGVGSLTDGMTVEVKGTLNTSNEIAALEIELPDSVFVSTDNQVELEGIVTDYISPSSFKVNGQTVNASGISIPANLTLANGVQIEVEGTYSSGSSTLTATKIEGRDGEIKIKAMVSSLNPTQKTIVLDLGSGTITVQLDNNSQLEDEKTGASSACANSIFCITDITVGDYLEVEAKIDGNGLYIVEDLKRKDPPSQLRNKVEGTVTTIGGTTGAETVRILGVDFSTDGSTTFKINDVDITTLSPALTRADFFTLLSIGATVEVKENYSSGTGPTGTVDEMDLKM